MGLSRNLYKGLRSIISEDSTEVNLGAVGKVIAGRIFRLSAVTVNDEGA